MQETKKHVVFSSVSELLEKTPEERKDYEMRCELLTALRTYIQKSDMTQAAIAKTLGVAQPRVSDLARGQVSKFSVGTLLEFMLRLGFKVSIKQAAPKLKPEPASHPKKSTKRVVRKDREELEPA